MSQSLLRNAHRFHHVFEFMRFKRKRGIRSSVRSRQSQMLFDDGCAKRDRRNWNSNSHGVVGEADRNAKPLREFRKRPQIHFVSWCGISAGTFQQADFACTCTSRCGQRLLNFLDRSHAG